MSEEIKTDANDINIPEEGNEEDFIKVPAAAYDALLEGYDTLEEQNKELRTKKDDINIDDLLSDKTPQPPAEQNKVNLEEMSNTDLVNFIFQNVDGVGKQIMQRLDTVSLTNEIERCMDNHDDFKEYQNDIQKVAAENPKLSIERVYKLVKAEKGGFDIKEEKGEDEKEKRSTAERLYNLPKRQVYGEKPTASTVTTKEKTIMSSKEAADKAWDEVMERQGG